MTITAETLSNTFCNVDLRPSQRLSASEASYMMLPSKNITTSTVSHIQGEKNIEQAIPVDPQLRSLFLSAWSNSFVAIGVTVNHVIEDASGRRALRY